MTFPNGGFTHSSILMKSFKCCLKTSFGVCRSRADVFRKFTSKLYPAFTYSGAFIYLRTAKFQQTHTSAPRTAVTTRMSSNATLVRELIKCFLLFVIMCMQSLEQVYAYFLSSFWGEKKKTKVNIIGSQEGLLLSKLICSDAIFSFICNRHLPTPLAGN